MTDPVRTIFKLPDELANFPWNHGRSEAGRMIARPTCLVCHDGEQAPVCQTCHPSTPNPDGTGAPALTEDMLQDPDRTLHYPERSTAEMIKGKLRGFVQSISRLWKQGDYSGVSETLSVGAEWKTGAHDKLTARVTATGNTYFADPPVGQNPRSFSLDEASLRYRHDGKISLDLEGGKINVLNSFGRIGLVGGQAGIYGNGISTSAFFGGLPTTDIEDALHYGGSVAINQSGNTTSAGINLDMLGRVGGDIPRFAVNGSLSGYNPSRNLLGNVSGKFFLNPNNPFSPLEKVVGSFSSSLGFLTVFSNLYFQPAQSDNPFEGNTKNTFSMQSGVQMKPVQFVEVEYSYGNMIVGEATYLFSHDHRVRVIFKPVTNLSIAPAYHQVGSPLYGEIDGKREIARDYGVTVAAAIRGFYSSVEVQRSENRQFYIFAGSPEATTSALISAGYETDRFNVSGRVVLNQHTGVESAMVNVEFTLGRKNSTSLPVKEADHLFINLIGPSDPVLKTMPSFAVVPPDTCPPDTSMHHQKMVEADMYCVDCHKPDENGMMSYPPRELCNDCHAPGHNIDINYDPEKCYPEPNYDFFVHNESMLAPAGEIVHNSVCTAACHPDVPEKALATRADIPKMKVCIECHEPPEPKQLTIDYCSYCHPTNPAKPHLLDTSTPLGTLKPSDPDNPVTGRIFHSVVWRTVHSTNVKATPDNQVLCAVCHDQGGCNVCHGPTATHRPADHTADWLTGGHFNAAVDKIIGQDGCGACHKPTVPGKEATACLSCHIPKAVPTDRQHMDGVRFVCTRSNPINGHQDFTSLLSGIDFCTGCHPTAHTYVEQGALDCFSCHDAENLGTCNHD